LHIGRHCGGYRAKSYEGKTHMILPRCLWGDSPARRRFVTVFHQDQGGDHYNRPELRTQLKVLGVTPLPSLLPILWILK
jgi:hypothetical protein